MKTIDAHIEVAASGPGAMKRAKNKARISNTKPRSRSSIDEADDDAPGGGRNRSRSSINEDLHDAVHGPEAKLTYAMMAALDAGIKGKRVLTWARGKNRNTFTEELSDLIERQLVRK